MRKYYLANTESRDSVDLRDYRDEIRAAILSVMPNAQIVVSAKWYSVSPTPERGVAIKIGRLLSSKDLLGKHCVQIPKLFNSIAIDDRKEKENNDRAKQKPLGGHFPNH